MSVIDDLKEKFKDILGSPNKISQIKTSEAMLAAVKEHYDSQIRELEERVEFLAIKNNQKCRKCFIEQQISELKTELHNMNESSC